MFCHLCKLVNSHCRFTRHLRLVVLLILPDRAGDQPVEWRPVAKVVVDDKVLQDDWALGALEHAGTVEGLHKVDAELAELELVRGAKLLGQASERLSVPVEGEECLGGGDRIHKSQINLLLLFLR